MRRLTRAARAKADMASFERMPCCHMPLRWPKGAPPLPPCSRHTGRPLIAGCRHGRPSRLQRAAQRGASHGSPQGTPFGSRRRGRVALGIGLPLRSGGFGSGSLPRLVSIRAGLSIWG